jgi:hypothetical protein
MYLQSEGEKLSPSLGIALSSNNLQYSEISLGPLLFAFGIKALKNFNTAVFIAESKRNKKSSETDAV